MNFTDKLLMMLTLREDGFRWGAAAVSTIVMFFLFLGIALYGAITGSPVSFIVGGVSAVLCVVLTVVSVIVNIRKNTPRW